LNAKRLSLLLLLGLLVAALVGPGMAAGAEPRTTVVESIMIHNTAFRPFSDVDGYRNGQWLELESDGGGGGRFAASIPLPATVVSFRRITLYAYDNSESADVSMSLYRQNPALGSPFVELGALTTVGATETDPQAVYTTAISPRKVDTSRFTLFLWLRVPDPGFKVYGVKVTYSYETGT
jgi:hypothetical protein